MSSIGWVIRFCAVSYWELKVGVALHFGNQSPWSSANEKGIIDSLVAWLIPTIRLHDQLTYLPSLDRHLRFITFTVSYLPVTKASIHLLS